MTNSSISVDFLLDIADAVETLFGLPNVYMHKQYINEMVNSSDILCVNFETGKLAVMDNTSGEKIQDISPIIVYTSDPYFKATILMLLSEYEYHMGLPYIISSFYTWAEFILNVYTYTLEKNDILAIN